MDLKKIAILSLACAMPLAAVAEPPVRQGGADGRGRGGPDKAHAGRPEGDRKFGEWSKEDREKFRRDFVEFCRNNAPKRWAVIEKDLPNDSDRLPVQAWELARRYRGLQMFADDKELHEIKLKQIRAEDEEFGILQALADPEAKDEAKRQQLEEELKKHSTRYLRLRIDERKLRISRINKMLEGEEKKLAADEAAFGEQVAGRVNTLKQEGPSALTRPRDGRNGPDGRGPDGRGPEGRGPEGPRGPRQHEGEGAPSSGQR